MKPFSISGCKTRPRGFFLFQVEQLWLRVRAQSGICSPSLSSLCRGSRGSSAAMGWKIPGAGKGRIQLLPRDSCPWQPRHKCHNSSCQERKALLETPRRSRSFTPGHPSEAAGNEFQLDQILPLMAEPGWGTLPAPADPEPSPALPASPSSPLLLRDTALALLWRVQQTRGAFSHPLFFSIFSFLASSSP